MLFSIQLCKSMKLNTILIALFIKNPIALFIDPLELFFN